MPPILSLHGITDQIPVAGEEWSVEALLFNIVIEYNYVARVFYVEDYTAYTENLALIAEAILLDKEHVVELEAKEGELLEQVKYLGELGVSEQHKWESESGTGSAPGLLKAQSEEHAAQAEIRANKGEIKNVEADIKAKGAEKLQVERARASLDNENLRQLLLSTNPVHLQMAVEDSNKAIALEQPVVINRQNLAVGTPVGTAESKTQTNVIREYYTGRIDLDNPSNIGRSNQLKMSVTFYVPYQQGEEKVSNAWVENLKIAIPFFAIQCSVSKSLASSGGAQ